MFFFFHTYTQNTIHTQRFFFFFNLGNVFQLPRDYSITSNVYHHKASSIIRGKYESYLVQKMFTHESLKKTLGLLVSILNLTQIYINKCFLRLYFKTLLDTQLHLLKTLLEIVQKTLLQSVYTHNVARLCFLLQHSLQYQLYYVQKMFLS